MAVYTSYLGTRSNSKGNSENELNNIIPERGFPYIGYVSFRNYSYSDTLFNANNGVRSNKFYNSTDYIQRYGCPIVLGEENEEILEYDKWGVQRLINEDYYLGQGFGEIDSNCHGYALNVSKLYNKIYGKKTSFNFSGDEYNILSKTFADNNGTGEQGGKLTDDALNSLGLMAVGQGLRKPARIKLGNGGEAGVSESEIVSEPGIKLYMDLGENVIKNNIEIELPKNGTDKSVVLDYTLFGFSKSNESYAELKILDEILNDRSGGTITDMENDFSDSKELKIRASSSDRLGYGFMTLNTILPDYLTGDANGDSLGSDTLDFNYSGNDASVVLYKSDTSYSVSNNMYPAGFIETLDSSTCTSEIEKMRCLYTNILCDIIKGVVGDNVFDSGYEYNTSYITSEAISEIDDEDDGGHTPYTPDSLHFSYDGWNNQNNEDGESMVLGAGNSFSGSVSGWIKNGSNSYYYYDASTSMFWTSMRSYSGNYVNAAVQRTNFEFSKMYYTTSRSTFNKVKNIVNAFNKHVSIQNFSRGAGGNKITPDMSAGNGVLSGFNDSLIVGRTSKNSVPGGEKGKLYCYNYSGDFEAVAVYIDNKEYAGISTVALPENANNLLNQYLVGFALSNSSTGVIEDFCTIGYCGNNHFNCGTYVNAGENIYAMTGNTWKNIDDIQPGTIFGNDNNNRYFLVSRTKFVDFKTSNIFLDNFLKDTNLFANAYNKYINHEDLASLSAKFFVPYLRTSENDSECLYNNNAYLTLTDANDEYDLYSSAPAQISGTEAVEYLGIDEGDGINDNTVSHYIPMYNSLNFGIEPGSESTNHRCTMPYAGMLVNPSSVFKSVSVGETLKQRILKGDGIYVKRLSLIFDGDLMDSKYDGITLTIDGDGSQNAISFNSVLEFGSTLMNYMDLDETTGLINIPGVDTDVTDVKFAVDPSSNITTVVFSFSGNSTPSGIINVSTFTGSGILGSQFSWKAKNARIDYTGLGKMLHMTDVVTRGNSQAIDTSTGWIQTDQNLKDVMYDAVYGVSNGNIISHNATHDTYEDEMVQSKTWSIAKLCGSIKISLSAQSGKYATPEESGGLESIKILGAYVDICDDANYRLDLRYVYPYLNSAVTSSLKSIMDCSIMYNSNTLNNNGVLNSSIFNSIIRTTSPTYSYTVTSPFLRGICGGIPDQIPYNSNLENNEIYFSDKYSTGNTGNDRLEEEYGGYVEESGEDLMLPKNNISIGSYNFRKANGDIISDDLNVCRTYKNSTQNDYTFVNFADASALSAFQFGARAEENNHGNGVKDLDVFVKVQENNAAQSDIKVNNLYDEFIKSSDRDVYDTASSVVSFKLPSLLLSAEIAQTEIYIDNTSILTRGMAPLAPASQDNPHIISFKLDCAHPNNNNSNNLTRSLFFDVNGGTIYSGSGVTANNNIYDVSLNGVNYKIHKESIESLLTSTDSNISIPPEIIDINHSISEVKNNSLYEYVGSSEDILSVSGSLPLQINNVDSNTMMPYYGANAINCAVVEYTPEMLGVTDNSIGSLSDNEIISKLNNKVKADLALLNTNISENDDKISAMICGIGVTKAIELPSLGGDTTLFTTVKRFYISACIFNKNSEFLPFIISPVISYIDPSTNILIQSAVQLVVGSSFGVFTINGREQTEVLPSEETHKLLFGPEPSEGAGIKEVINFSDSSTSIGNNNAELSLVVDETDITENTDVRCALMTSTGRISFINLAETDDVTNMGVDYEYILGKCMTANDMFIKLYNSNKSTISTILKK